MARVTVRRVAVSALAAAGLVLVPAFAATADSGSSGPQDAIDAVAADPGRVGVWVPGERQRALRMAELGGLRYTAAAVEHAHAVRSDALAIGAAALEASAAVRDLHSAVDTWTSVAFEDTTARLEGLLRRSGWESDTAPADAAEAVQDLRTAQRITAAASELFRLSHQVEVAAGAVDVEEELLVPSGLRAPEAIDAIDEGAEGAEGAEGPAAEAAEGPAAEAAEGTAAEDTPGDAPPQAGGEEGPGAPDPSAPADTPSPVPSAPTPAASGPEEPAAPAGPGATPEGGPDPAEGVPGDGAGQAHEGAGSPAGTPDPPGAAPEGSDGATQGPDDVEATGPDGGAPGPDDSSAAAGGPATDLSALPEEYATGITDLEQRVAALATVLGAGTDRPVGLLVLEPEGAGAEEPTLLDRVAYQGPGAGPWENGRIPTEELCPVSFALESRLRCDAAAALELLNVEYRAHFGEDLGIVSAYRSLDQQISVRASRGWLAAPPGTSKHGLGIAVDLAGFGGLGQFDNPRHVWMRQHGPRFGWEHPRIMRPGGGGPPEPWHFEFVGAGTTTGTATGTGAGSTRAGD